MGTRGKALIGILIGILFQGLFAGCGGGGENVLSPPPILLAIEVTPTNPVIALGTSQRLTATGIYSDGSKKDLTATVTWSSATAAVATVSNTAGSKGVATAVAVGSTVITATTESVSSTTSTLTVTSATLVTIRLSPASATIARGTNQQFIAVGIFNDNSKQDITFDVTWASSSPAVVTIGNNTATKGLATAVGAGTTTISAKFNAVSASATLNVTTVPLVAIEVAPPAPSTPRGTTIQFSATGVYSDSSTQDLTQTVTWSSLNQKVATVSNAPGVNGLVTAVAAGSTSITATSGSLSGSTALNVTAATLTSIEVTPTNPKLPTKTTLQLTAMGIYSDHSTVDLTSQVIWNSSTATATISNSAGTNGLATASAAVGTTTVTATMGVVSGTTLITVTPAEIVAIDVTPPQPSMAQGTRQQFAATGTYSDNTTQDLTAAVTWTSSDETIATISNAGATKGVATPVAVGSTTITATSGGIVSTDATLTVNAATLKSLSILPLTPQIAIAVGTTQIFKARGNFSDGSIQDLTTQVAWNSSALTVATISNEASTKGVATAIDSGQTIIRAAFGNVTTSATLTVTSATLASITIIPTFPFININSTETQQFTATGRFSDSSTQDLTQSVTWISSNKDIATISNAKGTQGLAKGLGIGTTTIRAVKSNSTVAAEAFLTVQ